MPVPHDFRHLHTLNRRDVLRAGSLGLFGLGLGDLLRGRAAFAGEAALAEAGRAASFGRAKSCILMFMWGGPAHQDTWDLKPDAPAEIRGEFKPIATKTPGIQICEHLPLLAQRTDKLAIIRSMTHTDVNHLTGTHYMLTGQAPPTAPSCGPTGPTSAPCCRGSAGDATRCRRSSRCGRN